MTSPPSDLTRKYRVTGRVQGVFFRASTSDVATGLGMTGRAVNLADGSVEVIATGTAEAHAELEAYLHEGPRRARVDEVSVKTVESQAFDSFRTG